MVDAVETAAVTLNAVKPRHFKQAWGRRSHALLGHPRPTFTAGARLPQVCRDAVRTSEAVPRNAAVFSRLEGRGRGILSRSGEQDQAAMISRKFRVAVSVRVERCSGRMESLIARALTKRIEAT